jgi:hypothetical protein
VARRLQNATGMKQADQQLWMERIARALAELKKPPRLATASDARNDAASDGSGGK